MRAISLLGASLLVVLGGAVLAQSPNPHAGHAMPSTPASKGSPSTVAYEAAAARMHKDMTIPYTGNADVDFAKGMIPHHQGAIDMARIVLEYGKDPELKKLAQEIVQAQEKEIAVLNSWLKTKGQ